MNCDEAKQVAMEMGWTTEQRRRASEALNHLETCADCREAMDGTEKVAEILKSLASGEPIGGWRQFEERLVETVTPVGHERRMWIGPAIRIAAAFLLGIL